MAGAILAAFAMTGPSSSIADPIPGFSNELVVSNLVEPVDLAFLPDGRLLILEKSGRILITDPEAAVPAVSNYMTLTDIETSGETGLIAVALDPAFATNGYFYLYYSPASRASFRVARFTHQGTTASPTSEFLVWENPRQINGCCHFGGGLDFGPDGAIYVTTGDTFQGATSQDLSVADGKILRINSDGSIPAGNPYLGNPGALPEIWAIGLRNPFRAAWDIPGNRFYVADVGGNDQNEAFEEVHIGRAGGNYGWPFCEGECPEPAYDDPLYAYPHSGSGASITGGFVYRGTAFPGSMQGAYFFADYVRGFIRYLVFDAQGDVSTVSDLDPAAGTVVALAEGPDGALYYVDIFSGDLRRIVNLNANDRPVIELAMVDVASGVAPHSVTFSGSASDPDGDPLDITWLFGDGSQGSGAQVDHTYMDEGLFAARMRVEDGTHTVFSEDIAITVGLPPRASIDAPVAGALFRAGDVIEFSGTGSDPDGVLGPANFSWDIRFRHNEHTHPAATADGPGGSFVIGDSGHDYSDETGYEFHLTVTDQDGLSATDFVSILPDKVDVSFDTSAPIDQMRLDGVVRSTPFDHDTLIGFRHTVSVPEETCVAGTLYKFTGWSDTGAATHEFVVPNADTTLAASFAPSGPCPRVQIGLQLLYRFDSGTGDTVRDRSDSGLGLDLTIADESAVDWLPGGGLSVNAPTVIASGGPATGLLEALQASEALSLEAWLQPGDLSGLTLGPARIVAFSENGFPDGGNLLLGQTLAAASQFSARLRTSGTDQYGKPDFYSAPGSATQQLRHVIFTREAGGQERIYLDGAEVNAGTRTGDLSNWGSYALALANEPDGQRPWLGSLHLVAIYDRALGADEVSQNFDAGPGAGTSTDTDGDGVADPLDNCSAYANPGQGDADADGFGNPCDADLNNDGVVNFSDLAELKQHFGTNDAVADLDENGIVNFADLGIMRDRFGSPPGPSGRMP